MQLRMIATFKISLCTYSVDIHPSVILVTVEPSGQIEASSTGHDVYGKL